MTQKTICVLLPNHWDAGKGGAEYQTLCLVERMLETTDFRVVYLARHVPGNRAGYLYELLGFRGPRVPGGIRWGRWLDTFDLYRQLKDIAPDAIVHMVACAYTGVAAYYARRHDCSLVWYLASDMDVEPKPVLGVGRIGTVFDMPLFRYGARHADYVIAQTRKQADRMRQTMSREADLVVGNFHPAPEASCEKSDPFTVLWVANMKELKRPELFVQLAEALCHEGNFSFRMIGRAEDSDSGVELLAWVDRLPCIEYLGEMEVEEVNRQMEAAHVFVNTSDYEGFPNTFIQAWMRKVPTLSINVDPDGIISRHGLGRCCGSLEGLKSALMEYYEDRERLAQDAEKCARYAVENFGMSNADRVIELIRRAANG